MNLTHPNYQFQLEAHIERGFTVTNQTPEGTYLAGPFSQSVFIYYLTGIVRMIA